MYAGCLYCSPSCVPSAEGSSPAQRLVCSVVQLRRDETTPARGKPHVQPNHRAAGVSSAAKCWSLSSFTPHTPLGPKFTRKKDEQVVKISLRRRERGRQAAGLQTPRWGSAARERAPRRSTRLPHRRSAAACLGFGASSWRLSDLSGC